MISIALRNEVSWQPQQKTGGSSYAPNYTPSFQMGTPPQAQMGNTSSQGGLWSPIHTGQLAQTAMGCSPSRFTSFQYTGGLLQHYPPGNKCQQMSYKLSYTHKYAAETQSI